MPPGLEPLTQKFQMGTHFPFIEVCIQWYKIPLLVRRILMKTFKLPPWQQQDSYLCQQHSEFLEQFNICPSPNRTLPTLPTLNFLNRFLSECFFYMTLIVFDQVLLRYTVQIVCRCALQLYQSKQIKVGHLRKKQQTRFALRDAL